MRAKRSPRPKRVVFLALETTRSAATRAHCDLPAALLRERGVVSSVLTPPENSADMAFSDRPRVVKSIYAFTFTLPVVFVNVVRALRADVVVVQRAIFRYDSPPIFEAAIARAQRLVRRGKLVVNLDDALYEYRPVQYRQRLLTADVVSTGNAEIAKFANDLGVCVLRYPGVLEVARYQVKIPRPANKRIVIGWTGTVPEQDLAKLGPVLSELSGLRPNIVVRIVSRKPYRLPDAVIQEWRSWEADGAFSYLADFDIGLMPIEDNPYNRAKESYKVKEYMAAGLAVIASPVGHNTTAVQHDVDGLLAASAADWLAMLLKLVDSSAERARLGAAARVTALRRWDRNSLNPYVDALVELSGVAR